MKTKTLHYDLTSTGKNPHSIPMLTRRWSLTDTARAVFDMIADKLVDAWK